MRASVVREAKPDDADAWLQLRGALWPEGSAAEHREEIDRYFAGEFPRDPWAVFLAEDEHGSLVGVAELSLRPYAEGCQSTPVAYLEGWYVQPEARGQGVGLTLIRSAETWARSLGCTELASDTSPDNDFSEAAHRSVGFTDVGLVRCFRKVL